MGPRKGGERGRYWGAAYILTAALLLGAAAYALGQADPFRALEGPGTGRVYLAYRDPQLAGWLEGERDGQGGLAEAQLQCWPADGRDDGQAVYRRARQIVRYYVWRYGAPEERGPGEYRWSLPGGGEAGLTAAPGGLRVWYRRGPAGEEGAAFPAGEAPQKAGRGESRAPAGARL